MTVEHVEWSGDDVVRHLRASPVFSRLADDALAAVAQCATVRMVTAGDAVMIEGEPGDEAFVIIAGRLDVLTRTSNGGQKTVNTVGPGDVVGEMALMTEEPRSASVRARRDSALMCIGADDFRTIMVDHPSVLLDMTRTVMGRLNQSIHDMQPEGTRTVIAVLPAGERPAHYEFASGFATALQQQDAGSQVSVEAVSAERARRDLGDDATTAAIAEYLHHVEDRNDVVVLIGETGNAEWTELCRRQSDVGLLVGYADSLREYGDYEQDLETAGGDSVQLVLVHDATQPTATAEVLSLRPCGRYHHIRRGSSDDIARVARIVRGSSVGVVFGGGGARGFAHLGAVRAFQEAGIPIDHVGGTSIGASVASTVAMGLDLDGMIELLRWVTFDRGSIVDSTLPTVSIAKGRRLSTAMHEGYGDIDIRDLWMEFFCVSADLTEGDVHVHRRGPVWEAVRASVAIPGIFPPMRSSDGHVLVDGGVLDNVPTSVMRSVFAPARMIAIDLKAPSALPSADIPDSGFVSGWKVARHRAAPWRDGMEIPGIIETLIAASTISGAAKDIDADLVIRPSVAEYGFLDFASWEQIMETGYQHTVEALEASTLPV
ncbi:MAG: patatin-like phospholipase family protein [Acidimicrobiia bacterium]|nr:patatin-like phospholipase family protein [Acidimicrobiia bacterium]